MIDIHNIKKKKIGKISKLFKKSDKFNLRVCEDNTFAHKACHFIKKHDELEILNIYFDLDEILTGKFPYCYCGFYDENNNFKTEDAFLKLLGLMEKNKTIYIIADINHYYVLLEKNPKKKAYHKKINTLQMHSVSIVFYPIDRLKYNVLYINSHGSGIRNEAVFEKKISNTRIKEYKFKKSLHYIFIRKFVDILQYYTNKNFNDPLFKGTIQLKYNISSKHNYYGCNLQSGDFYGVCYIFPLIIWTYLNKYYHKKRHVGLRKTIIIPPVAEMLRKGKLELFVKMCFLNFSEEFDKMLLSKSNKHINEFIEKKGTFLIKQILNKFICFISQKEIRLGIIENKY